MKKISLKTAVAAVSLSLALVPVGFAQSPAATPVAATKNTQPLPGARIASQAEALFAGGALTTTGIVVGVVAIAAVAGIVAQQNANKDDLLQQLLASGIFTINASGQLSQVR